ncbi:MAG: homogentisate 1,2-dioxygenase [Planctomyces sp.]|nr:homogentisate 1,2-dioxygenase [Planctomyces sp.]MBA4039041.1 homogentisate 1,2-dioxygenase [Planctomyces sp.]MBA4120005.1 homogentisate 1,2-dioxygenase [Isosphaera sp.]
MPHYYRLGQLPKKRHTQFRRPDGVLYSEELFGTEGFTGPTSTMYHINPPTQVAGWRTLYSTKPQYVEADTMRMRHTRSGLMRPAGDPVTGRVVLYGNSDVEMSVCVPAEGMGYHYKNAQGDECIFVHFGTGVLYTMMGALRFGPKDYLVVPKGVVYRMEFDRRQSGPGGTPADGGPSVEAVPLGKFLTIETANGSHILPPKRYMSHDTAQFLEHAPYCERDLRLPEMPMTWNEHGAYEVRVKARGSMHAYVYDYHPLDIVGWDGCYYPYAFNIDDFAPITGKLHMPPPIHQTFEGHNFVICSFCPRMLDWHPQAIKVPYNHSNLDSDEVLYYVEGNFGSRKGIEIGSLTAHPQGIPHGPHPGTIEASLGATHTAELAVMCDTFRPLLPTQAAVELDDPKYPASWQGEHFPKLKGGHMTLNGHSAAAAPAVQLAQMVQQLGAGARPADTWAPGGDTAPPSGR